MQINRKEGLSVWCLLIIRWLPAEGSFGNLSQPKQQLSHFIDTGYLVWNVLYRQILIYVISVNSDFLKFPVSEWSYFNSITTKAGTKRLLKGDVAFVMMYFLDVKRKKNM